MRILPIMIAAACIAPVPAFAQATDAMDFVKQAGASDQFEIQSSKLELTSSNPKIRQFAQKMIADHTKSTAQVKMAAMKDGVKAGAPMLMPMQKDMIAQLRAANGTARDQLYLQQQQQSHQMALQLHQGYAQSGDKTHLKMAAAKIAPVVQSHIDMLNGMGDGSMSGM